MAVCAWLLERDEGAIAMSLHLLPAWYPNCPDDHLAEHEGVAPAMDQLHLRKIDLSDEIFVVNCQHYVGSSTTNEVNYAKSKGKPIRWYTDDEIGVTVEKMIADAIAAQLMALACSLPSLSPLERYGGNSTRALIARSRPRNWWHFLR